MAEPTLAQIYRARFPGAYDNKTDEEIEAANDAKFPGSYANVPRTRKESPLGAIGDFGEGILKGAVSTLTGAAHVVPKVFPGAKDQTQPGGFLHAADEFSKPDPNSTAQQAGHFLEQAGEFVIPGAAAEKFSATVGAKLPRLARIPLRMAVNASANAAYAGLHDDNPAAAAVAGAAGTLAGSAASATGRWVGRRALPFIKSGLKLTDTELAQQASARFKGLAGEQDDIAKFLLEKRWTTPQEAEANLQRLGQERAAAYAASGAKMNPGQVMMDALDDLAAKARQQSDGGVELLGIIDREKKRLMTGPLSRAGTVAPQATTPSAAMGTGTATPGKVDLTDGNSPQFRITGTGWASPKPGVVRTTTSMFPAAEGPPTNGLSAPSPIVGPKIAAKRVFRDDVSPAEVAQTIEADGKKLRGQWGKPNQAQATKAKNSALRIALKTEVPETQAMLTEEGFSKRTKTSLDRMTKRSANRDVYGWPIKMGSLAAAGAMGGGHVKSAIAIETLAVADQILRNNPLKAGYWAKDLADAVATKNAEKAGMILQRLGVGMASQLKTDDGGAP